MAMEKSKLYNLELKAELELSHSLVGRKPEKISAHSAHQFNIQN